MRWKVKNGMFRISFCSVRCMRFSTAGTGTGTSTAAGGTGTSIGTSSTSGSGSSTTGMFPATHMNIHDAFGAWCVGSLDV